MGVNVTKNDTFKFSVTHDFYKFYKIRERSASHFFVTEFVAQYFVLERGE